MIEVHLAGTNSFSLKGDTLTQGKTTIALHDQGWAIDLDPVGFPRYVEEGLHFNAVIPKLKAMLDNVYSEEEINEGEVLKYMDSTLRYMQTRN